MGTFFLAGSIRRTAYFGTNTVTAANNGIDMFIASYNTNGSLIWVRNYGGGSTESPQCITTDGAGSLYVAGSFSGATTSIGGIVLSNGSALSSDIFVAKFDHLGTVVWAQSAGGTDNEADHASGISVDGFGNVYLSGNFSSSYCMFGPYTLTNNTGSTATYLAKFTPVGNVVWARKIITHPSLPAQERSSVTDMVMDNAGNVFVSGHYLFTTVFVDGFALSNPNDNGQNIFVAKFSPNGEAVWALGGGGSDDDVMGGLALDGSRNVYGVATYWGGWTFGQRTLPASPRYSLSIFKISSDGEVQWAYGAGISAAT
jgi:hypothetical protein